MIEFIQAHAKDIIDALAYIVLAASVIVKLTPTKLDDNIVAKLLQILSISGKTPTAK